MQCRTNHLLKKSIIDEFFFSSIIISYQKDYVEFQKKNTIIRIKLNNEITLQLEKNVNHTSFELYYKKIDHSLLKNKLIIYYGVTQNMICQFARKIIKG